jgi:hypothetical protein
MAESGNCYEMARTIDDAAEVRVIVLLAQHVASCEKVCLKEQTRP